MRDCRKFDLPERVPTTKAKKIIKLVISTKGNMASWHKCQNLGKGFPEAPGSPSDDNYKVAEGFRRL